MEDHPIHLAARRGDLAEVQRLITEDLSLMERRDARRSTPLLIAALIGHAEMVEWLLDQGADREMMRSKNKHSHRGRSSFMVVDIRCDGTRKKQDLSTIEIKTERTSGATRGMTQAICERVQRFPPEFVFLTQRIMSLA